MRSPKVLGSVLCLILLTCLLRKTVDGLSDKRLCADPNCQKIISHGIGVIKYNAGEEGMVSFTNNAKIRIMSKSAGSQPRLWGVEVNGRRGYAPKEFIRETQVIFKKDDLKYEVPVHIPGTEASAPVETTSESYPPVLKASKQAIEKIDIETTTTAPLGVVPASDATISVEKSDDSTTLKPKPSTVQQREEVVDGTKLPTMEIVEKLSDIGSVNQEPLNKQLNEIEESEENVEYAQVENTNVTSSEIGFEDKKEEALSNFTELPPAADDLSSIDLQTQMEGNTKKLTESVDDVNHKDDSAVVEIEITKPNPTPAEKENNTVELVKPQVTDEVIDPNSIVKNVAEESQTSTHRALSDSRLEEHTSGTIPILKTVQNTENNGSVSALKEEIAVDEVIRSNSLSETNDNELQNIYTSSQANSDIADIKIGIEGFKDHDNISEMPIETFNTTLKDNIDGPLNSTNVLLETNSSNNSMNESLITTSQYPEVNNNQPSAEVIEEYFEGTTENIAVTESGFHYEPNIDSSLYDVSTTPTPHVHQNENSEIYSATQSPATYNTVKTQNNWVENEQKDNAYPSQIDPNPTNDQPGFTKTMNQHHHLDQELKEHKLEPQNVNLNEFNEQTSQRKEIPHTHTTSKTVQNTVPELKQDIEDSADIGKGSVIDITSTEQQPDIPNIEPNNRNSNDQRSNSEEKKPDLVEIFPHTPMLKDKTEPTSVLLQSSTQQNGGEKASQDHGLFATILGTVNSFISSAKKEVVQGEIRDDVLDRILFSDRLSKPSNEDPDASSDFLHSHQTCHSPKDNSHIVHQTQSKNCQCEMQSISLDNFIEVLTVKIMDMSDMLACLGITAAALLFFVFGYYCFCNSSREGALLSKMNLLERSLLAMQKENGILKHELLETRGKLSSIEDNSFGSNDMVIALKNELETEIFEKQRLHEQVGNLEKELENAAEAGLELNKIVSELLSNQTGDESIISSVEELQRQLNEQQNTILEINSNLAEKSRENSELQLMIAEQNARLGGEIASLQQDNDELEAEKSNLQTRLDEIKNEFEEDITKALEGKNFEIKRLQNEITELKSKCEDQHIKWQTSLAKVEALEDCLKSVKKDPKLNIKELIDAANIRAELIDMQKQRSSLKERIEVEKDVRIRLEEQWKACSGEIEKLKHEYNQSEKDKLEAQTRLEVLSNYFKEKETQLQKELSIKEAMWLKQQGEKTSTVDRLTALQEEIQSLKSQNDSLRAEIEAQLAAHKAQTGTLENRAHETWLAARQSERRYEEARAEATALRRKLTAIVGLSPNEINRGTVAVGDVKLGAELNSAPSPIQLESPASPLLGRIPPPPFLPPPFMGPPPPFMGMPPPFMPPGEMRPPPLGRLMSPPPPSGGPPHSSHMRSSRYTPPDNGDYDDYDDDEIIVEHRGRRRSAGSWNRDSYSPPRTYRSHSPSDSRLNYSVDRDLVSTYDTETDFSPPPSPRDRRTRGSRAGSFKAYSPQPSASSPISEGGRNGRNKNKNKGVLSSGSEKSYDSSRQGNKGRSKV